MGFGGISIWQLLIVLAIIILLFGTKKLRSLGGDLGNAVKGFRGAMSEAENADAAKKDEKTSAKLEAEDQSRVIDAEAAKKDEKKV
ncbi:MAG TPA: twin-arginine translocase TatA/TatE family subunit [Candidatus Tenderia sp.]|nr:twin-arginine translocase TatA/TatE family subunit [Candidatus Tenderia sp.]